MSMLMRMEMTATSISLPIYGEDATRESMF